MLLSFQAFLLLWKGVGFLLGCRIFIVLLRLASTAERTLLSIWKTLAARSKHSCWLAGYFLERKSRSSVFSSFEVSLLWSRNGVIWEGGLAGVGRGRVRPGKCIWEEQPRLLLPISSPYRTHTDTCTLAVSLAAIFTAHLLGFNWSLQAKR